jgi:hypothetical protein
VTVPYVDYYSGTIKIANKSSFIEVYKPKANDRGQLKTYIFHHEEDGIVS